MKFIFMKKAHFIGNLSKFNHGSFWLQEEIILWNFPNYIMSLFDQILHPNT
jgi:hypothetical protein